MDLLIFKAFTVYQQLLSPTLRSKWDDIVQEHFSMAGWIKANGATSTKYRGQDWDTLEEYKCLHLLVVYKKDAAECHDLYINNNTKKPQQMILETFYKCVKEIDDLAPMLPYL